MKKTLVLTALMAILTASALFLANSAPVSAGPTRATTPASTTAAPPATAPSAQPPTPSATAALKSSPPPSSPSPTPTPDPTPPPDPVELILEGMTDEEMLGQMIMLGFQGRAAVPDNVAGLYRKYKAGGVMLFGWNVSSFAQAKKLIGTVEALNQYPDLPLFVAIDEEGGSVKRFAWRPALRSAAWLGRRGDPDPAYQQFLRVGKKLRETGINLNFAPVLDIAPDPSATFLGTRMYGSDPDQVIPVIQAAVKGLHDGGVFSLGKHFPGHGNTATDSHKSLPVISDTRRRLDSYSLKPFQAAIDTGVDAMLVGHLLVPALDKRNPASLSEKVIRGLLRGEMGFSGIVFSDDMRMGAITANYDIGEACVRFVEAGGDVLLIGKHPTLQAKALRALAHAVKSGRITRERLTESARRIVALKLRIKAASATPP